MWHTENKNVQRCHARPQPHGPGRGVGTRAHRTTGAVVSAAGNRRAFDKLGTGAPGADTHPESSGVRATRQARRLTPRRRTPEPLRSAQSAAFWRRRGTPCLICCACETPLSLNSGVINIVRNFCFVNPKSSNIIIIIASKWDANLQEWVANSR